MEAKQAMALTRIVCLGVLVRLGVDLDGDQGGAVHTAKLRPDGARGAVPAQGQAQRRRQCGDQEGKQYEPTCRTSQVSHASRSKE